MRMTLSQRIRIPQRRISSMLSSWAMIPISSDRLASLFVFRGFICILRPHCCIFRVVYLGLRPCLYISFGMYLMSCDNCDVEYSVIMRSIYYYSVASFNYAYLCCSFLHSIHVLIMRTSFVDRDPSDLNWVCKPSTKQY